MLSAKNYWIAMVESGRKAFADMPPALRTMSACCRLVAADPAGVIRHAPDRVRRHPGFPALCRTAVGLDGMALEFVPPQVGGYAALCFEAVQQDGAALQFVPVELRSEGLCVEAILHDGEAMAFVPEELQDQVKAELDRLRGR